MEKILDSIDVKNNIITLDANGAVPSIFTKIVDRKGDPVIALKNNQRKLKTLAINILKQETTENISLRRKRKLCGRRKEYLLKVILGSEF